MNETLKVLKERRSVRKYRAEQIKDEELNAMLDSMACELLRSAQSHSTT